MNRSDRLRVSTERLRIAAHHINPELAQQIIDIDAPWLLEQVNDLDAETQVLRNLILRLHTRNNYHCPMECRSATKDHCECGWMDAVARAEIAAIDRIMEREELKRS